MSKRVSTLQCFTAHSGRVQCARLGEKSGQVLATGGEDKRVNIWKVGKANALVSLTGHTSPVECLVFDKQEEVLVVGCGGGSMQVWNLEYRKMAGTLSGHRTACVAVEFHPYGEFFASGSADTNLKIWDLRRKSCIQTYKGHTGPISSIRFSPHGRWVATGGEDNVVKIWDLTAGKLMRDLDEHKGPITSMAFSPKEYLLASGSADRTAKLWSLETFQSVGTTDPCSSAVKGVKFYCEEHSLVCVSQDSLRVHPHGEGGVGLGAPSDSLDVDWKGLQDLRLCANEEKLIAVSAENSQVGILVADLARRDPNAVGPAKGPHGARLKTGGGIAVHGNARLPTAQQVPRRADPDFRPDFEVPGGEDPQPRQQTNPQQCTYAGLMASAATAIHANTVDRPRTGDPGGDGGGAALDQVASPADGSAAHHLHQRPLFGGVEGPRLTESRGGSSGGGAATPTPASDFMQPQASPLGVPPRTTATPSRRAPEVTPEQMGVLALEHPKMMGVLQRRADHIQRLKDLWARGNLAGLQDALNMPQDQPVFCDFARAIMKQRVEQNLTLDACAILLTINKDLLSSKYDEIVIVALQFAEVLLRRFGESISSTRRSCANIPERQLDLSREERLRKCNACHEQFREMQRYLLDSHLASRFSGFQASLQHLMQSC